MFIRKLNHPNGRVYIQVVEKRAGRYLLLKSFGAAVNDSEIKKLISKAEHWISQKTGALELDFSVSETDYEKLIGSITSVERCGYDLLIGPIFDEIGFNKINAELFRELVIARVAFPKSKLKTSKYLYRYKQIQWDEETSKSTNSAWFTY